MSSKKFCERLVERLPWRMILGLGLAMLSCTKYDDKRSTLRDAAAEPVHAYVMVQNGQGQKEEIYIAPQAKIESVGLCALNPSSSETCSKTHSSYLGADKLNIQGEREFFKLSQALQLNAELIYHIIDANADNLLQKVRFVNKQADPIAAGLAMIKEDVLRQELTDFSSDDLNGRLSGTPENVKAAEFITGHLKTLGIEPAKSGNYLQSFAVPKGPTRGQQTANIIALLPGQDPKLREEYVVIGAHLDHAGTLARGYTCSKGASGSNNICNGADDNGSGTIAVLNVAKALASVRQNLKRSIVLMWFSGEEEGLAGSYHYVRNDPVFPIAKTVWLKPEGKLFVFDQLKMNGKILDSSTYADRYELLPRVYSSPWVSTLPILRTVDKCLEVLVSTDTNIEGLVFKSPSTEGFQDTSIIRCRKVPAKSI